MFSLKLYMLPNLLSHIIGCDTLPRPVHPLSRQVPTAETMELPPWTFQHPRRHRTNADMMSIWQRDSASTVDPPTISKASALPWPPITPERSASPPPKSQLPQLLPLLLPSPSREKSSPLAACWLCWWTCPCLFFHIVSGNSLCISKLFVK
jgi:hypothetical protein